MLLFMVQPQGHPEFKVLPVNIRDPFYECNHLFVYIITVIEYLFHSGARQHAPLWTWVHVAMGIVITVEYKIEVVTIGFVSAFIIRQHKCLKKPGHVRDMPFRRTGLGNGLYLVVIRDEGMTKRFSKLPDLQVIAFERFTIRAGIDFGIHMSINIR